MKTGLNLQPISEQIVRRVMEQHNFTKLSPAINFIINEYNRLVNGEKITVEKPKEVPIEVEQKPVKTKTDIIQEDKPRVNFAEWFIVEERK